MPYTRLPLAKFQTLYPQFAKLTDLQYDAWAERLEPKVGDAYGDSQQEATELLLAHNLMLNGVGVPATAKIANEGATSFRDGSFSATLSDEVVQQRAKGGYAATIYGQQFATIQKRIFGGPILMGGC